MKKLSPLEMPLIDIFNSIAAANYAGALLNESGTDESTQVI